MKDKEKVWNIFVHLTALWLLIFFILNVFVLDYLSGYNGVRIMTNSIGEWIIEFPLVLGLIGITAWRLKKVSLT